MISSLHVNRSYMGYTFWPLFLLLVKIACTASQQIFVTTFVQSTSGTRFVPLIEPAQLISTTLADSVKKCVMSCTSNVLCRIYDYEVFGLKQCRLFEGEPITLGQIGPSPSSQSITGTIHLSRDLFAEYGSPCSSFCHHSRYLQCGSSSTCE